MAMTKILQLVVFLLAAQFGLAQTFNSGGGAGGAGAPGTWVRTATFSSATNYSSITIAAPQRRFRIRTTSAISTTNATFDYCYVRVNGSAASDSYFDQKHLRNGVSHQLASTVGAQAQACLIDGATATNAARSWVEMEFKNPTETNQIKHFTITGEVVGAGGASAYQWENHNCTYRMTTNTVLSVTIFPTAMFSNATTWELLEEIQ